MFILLRSIARDFFLLPEEGAAKCGGTAFSNYLDIISINRDKIKSPHFYEVEPLKRYA